MKLAPVFAAAALASAIVAASTTSSLAYTSKSTTVSSNELCTTKTIKVHEHGTLRTKSVRSCRSGPTLVFAPTATGLVYGAYGSYGSYGSTTHKCVTKTVQKHGYKSSEKVCY